MTRADTGSSPARYAVQLGRDTNPRSVASDASNENNQRPQPDERGVTEPGWFQMPGCRLGLHAEATLNRLRQLLPRSTGAPAAAAVMKLLHRVRQLEWQKRSGRSALATKWK